MTLVRWFKTTSQGRYLGDCASSVGSDELRLRIRSSCSMCCKINQHCVKRNGEKEKPTSDPGSRSSSYPHSHSHHYLQSCQTHSRGGGDPPPPRAAAGRTRPPARGLLRRWRTLIVVSGTAQSNVSQGCGARCDIVRVQRGSCTPGCCSAQCAR